MTSCVTILSMNISEVILIILGLGLFEIVSSIDNAVVNAEILDTMSAKSKRWFLVWGLLFAVVVVRGLLPWLIVWLATPGLGPIQAFIATFSNDPSIANAISRSTPILLAGGGTFLLFLFFHWLFLEKKEYGLPHERFFSQKSPWFYTVISILLSTLVWFGGKLHFLIACSIVIGAGIFFVTQGFKEYAEKQELQMSKGRVKHSDFSKILYLEIIDATFSIDGVLGAFAFTFSVPLIIIGNGLGALVLRQLTVSNIDSIKKYLYLKNGAMYSIFALGIIMLLNAFGVPVPEWVSPLTTFIVIGFFFWKSQKQLARR